jgi:hypothetical protein
MTATNGMKILGHNFRSAPKPKAAADTRNPLRELQARQQAERQRAAKRLERLRNATVSAAGRA